MKRRALPLALAAAGLLTAGAACAEDTTYSFSGFGTLGATHSNNRDLDFVGSVIQPNGPGHSAPTMFGVDTKAGVQAVARISADWTATVQAVADHRSDNSYAPRFEWANLKYQPTKDVAVRVGRVVAPVFMVSDYRNVGYAQTMVRMPVEVYGQNPITHLDGGDISYRFDLADGVVTIQATSGRVKEFPPQGAVAGRAKMMGISYEAGASTMRMGYLKSRVDIAGDFTAQIDQLTANGGAVGHPLPTLNFNGMKSSLFNIGYLYDNGTWLAQSELIQVRANTRAIENADAWYLMGGYRIGKFTPYISYSENRAKDQPLNQPMADGTCRYGVICGMVVNGMTVADQLQALAYGTNALDASVRTSWEQKTISIGARYDFYRNLALKAQFEHIRKPGSLASPSKGLFIAPAAVAPALYPNATINDVSVNLLTMTLDFVF